VQQEERHIEVALVMSPWQAGARQPNQSIPRAQTGHAGSQKDPKSAILLHQRPRTIPGVQQIAILGRNEKYCSCLKLGTKQQYNLHDE